MGKFTSGNDRWVNPGTLSSVGATQVDFRHLARRNNSYSLQLGTTPIWVCGNCLCPWARSFRQCFNQLPFQNSGGGSMQLGGSSSATSGACASAVPDYNRHSQHSFPFLIRLVHIILRSYIGQIFYAWHHVGMSIPPYRAKLVFSRRGARPTNNSYQGRRMRRPRLDSNIPNSRAKYSSLLFKLAFPHPPT